MKRQLAGVFLAVMAALVLSTDNVAQAQADTAIVGFYGQHPVNPAVGKGFCYISAPHFHSYAPHEPVVYRQNSEQYYYFVGDPSVYLYQGNKWGFYNHHPIPYSAGSGWCYIDGPHYHNYLPSQNNLPRYRTQNNLYWYTGAFDPWYYQYRPYFYAPTARFYGGLGYWPRPVYFGVRPLWWRQPFYPYTPAIYARWGYRGGLFIPPVGYYGPRFSGIYLRGGIRVNSGLRIGYGGFRAYRGGYGRVGYGRVGYGRAGYGRVGRVGVVGPRAGIRVGVGARAGFRGGARVGARVGAGARFGGARVGARVGGARAAGGARFGGARAGGGARFGGGARVGGGARYGGGARVSGSRSGGGRSGGAAVRGGGGRRR